MAISDIAFQADQNENMFIVEIDLDPLASIAVDLTSEIVSDNDEFEMNADDEKDDEFISSLDNGSEDELHPSFVVARKMSLDFKSGYLKEGWKWKYVPQSQRDIYWLRWKAELTRRLEEMSTQSPDTSIDEDVVYLEVVPEVKGRVYGLGSQGYHRSISLGKQAHLEDQRMDLMSSKSSSGTTRGCKKHCRRSEWNDKIKCRGTRWNAKKKIERCRTVCTVVAFGIGVAYKEGVDKASLFLLGFGWDTLC
ncbi:hypothetical protein Syun_002065 [Stephania yunnanensis]|uniref:Uncharacterized protein n=1 Tax=Stephania yunnanensis TaxID=152371 RepID=A0AAP0LFV5_9MAGN